MAFVREPFLGQSTTPCVRSVTVCLLQWTSTFQWFVWIEASLISFPVVGELISSNCLSGCLSDSARQTDKHPDSLFCICLVFVVCSVTTKTNVEAVDRKCKQKEQENERDIEGKEKEDRRWEKRRLKWGRESRWRSMKRKALWVGEVRVVMPSSRLFSSSSSTSSLYGLHRTTEQRQIEGRKDGRTHQRRRAQMKGTLHHWVAFCDIQETFNVNQPPHVVSHTSVRTHIFIYLDIIILRFYIYIHIHTYVYAISIGIQYIYIFI